MPGTKLCGRPQKIAFSKVYKLSGLLKVMFGLSNRRTRFSSKVSGWGVGEGKVKLLLRKKRFKCQFELSKPLLTNKVILGSNRSNTHYFANPEFPEELNQITRHVGASTFSFRSQFGHRSARKATAGLF